MAETPTNGNLHLTSGRLLARNVGWNLLGTASPLLVAVFAIPVLVHGLGTDRFGVLALVWALIGYASLFDIGLGRALTQLVAKKLGAGEHDEIPALAWTSLLLMLGLGVLGSAVIIAISPWLVDHALKVPGGIKPEVLRAFYLVGFAVPLVVAAAGLRGLLEAHQRFGLVNALRVPIGVMTFLGPLLVLPFSRSLVPVVAALIAVRFLGFCGFLWLCLEVVPELRRRVALHGPSVVPLLRFGGWMTVTNVVSPLMVSFDRFVLGAMVSVGAVAYYATPSEAITKLAFLPSVIVGVLFPAFSSGFVQNKGRTKLLFDRGVKYAFLATFPVLLIAAVFAREGLNVWVGPDFAAHSTVVLQWLAIGVFFNGIAQIPFGFIQGIGRPDITGKLHLCELPAYAVLLWSLVHARGVEGAAMAWTVRAVVDSLVLFGASYWLLSTPSRNLRDFVLSATSALLLLVAASAPMPTYGKFFFASATLICFGLVYWFAVLDTAERLYAKTIIRAS